MSVQCNKFRINIFLKKLISLFPFFLTKTREVLPMLPMLVTHHNLLMSCFFHTLPRVKVNVKVKLTLCF